MKNFNFSNSYGMKFYSYLKNPLIYHQYNVRQVYPSVGKGQLKKFVVT